MHHLRHLRLHRTQIPLLSSPKPFTPFLSNRLISSTPIKDNYPARKGTTDQLSGRVCMITGGSSGIGYAIAERFLQEGADRIIVVGRSYERLINAASRLQRATSADENITLPDGEVATRALEEEEGAQQRSPERRDQATDFTPGSLIPSSDRISLLVGDVSEASGWARELEKAMVCMHALGPQSGPQRNSLTLGL